MRESGLYICWLGNNYENFFFQNNVCNRIHCNLMKIKLYLLTLLTFIMAVYNNFFPYVCQEFHAALKAKASIYAF